MNCHEFLDHLQVQLDGDSAPLNTLPLTEHRKECPACRAQYEAAHLMLEALKRQPILMPPPGMTDRIVARVLGARRIRTQQRWLAVAASILVAGIGLWVAATVIDSRRHGDNTTGAIARHEIPKATPDSRMAFRDRLAEVRNLTLGATRQVVQETVSTASALVPSPDIIPMPPLPAPIETSLAPFRQVGNTVASGVEPVANTAIQAWDTLRKEFMSFEER